MPIYIATPLTPSSDSLNQAVEESIAPENRYPLQNQRGWLIKYPGTTVELCNHIGLTGQAPGESSTVGSTIIVPVHSYYGRGPTDMWEWIATRSES